MNPESVLELIRMRGIPLSQGAIAKLLDININTARKYLKWLENQGLIKSFDVEIVIREYGVLRDNLRLVRVRVYTV